MQSGQAPKVKLVRLFADAEGKSHFGEVEVETLLTDFVPPAPSLYVSEPAEARRTFFLVIPVGWVGRSHPAPRRQVTVLMKGSVEVTTSDGERRVVKQGEATLLEDTFGEGHSTRNVGKEPVFMAVIQY